MKKLAPKLHNIGEPNPDNLLPGTPAKYGYIEIKGVFNGNEAVTGYYIPGLNEVQSYLQPGGVDEDNFYFWPPIWEYIRKPCSLLYITYAGSDGLYVISGADAVTHGEYRDRFKHYDNDWYIPIVYFEKRTKVYGTTQV